MEAASHANPQITMRCGWARGSLDRHATDIITADIAGAVRYGEPDGWACRAGRAERTFWVPCRGLDAKSAAGSAKTAHRPGDLQNAPADSAPAASVWAPVSSRQRARRGEAPVI